MDEHLNILCLPHRSAGSTFSKTPCRRSVASQTASARCSRSISLVSKASTLVASPRYLTHCCWTACMTSSACMAVQEWFRLVTAALFEPQLGLFLLLPESRYYWFSGSPDPSLIPLVRPPLKSPCMRCCSSHYNMHSIALLVLCWAWPSTTECILSWTLHLPSTRSCLPCLLGSILAHLHSPIPLYLGLMCSHTCMQNGRSPPHVPQHDARPGSAPRNHRRCAGDIRQDIRGAIACFTTHHAV
jgi:hypothetical protein